MTSGAMIYSPDNTLHMSADTFVTAILARWPQAEIVHDSESELTDVTARIPDTRWQQIFHDANGTQLRTEAGHEDQLVFAAWAANLVPDDGQTHLLLLNSEATLASPLTPGMTPAEINSALTMDPPV